MTRRTVLSLLLMASFLSTASAVTVPQHFGAEPELDLPSRFETMAPEALDRWQGEIQRRMTKEVDDPYLAHRLATILYHQGRVDEAVRAWERASRQEPNLAPADLMQDLQQVFSLLAKGQLDAARERLAAAAEKYAENPHFQLARAEQAMRGRNPEEAEKSYLRAHELGPELYVTSLNLGRFYEAQGDHAAARKYYREATERAPRRAECWNALGRHQFREGLVDAARASFRKARDADALQPLAEVRLGQLSAEIGDQLGARRWYRTAVPLAGSEGNAVRVALSDVLMRLGRLEEAGRELETVLREEELVPLLVALGYVQESRGDAAAAEKSYRRALQLAPGNVIAGNNLAMLLVKAGRSPAEALQLAGAARELFPTNGPVLGTYACALFHAGRRDEAADALRRSVRLTPDDPWVRYCYGKLLHAEKRTEEARFQLEGCLILAPDFPRKAEVEKLLAEG